MDRETSVTAETCIIHVSQISLIGFVCDYSSHDGKTCEYISCGTILKPVNIFLAVQFTDYLGMRSKWERMKCTRPGDVCVKRRKVKVVDEVGKV